MSLVIKTDIYQKEVECTNRKPQSRGFILTLVCMALFLVFASLIFPPSSTNSGQTNAVVRRPVNRLATRRPKVTSAMLAPLPGVLRPREAKPDVSKSAFAS
jgi:hypothetical protein